MVQSPGQSAAGQVSPPPGPDLSQVTQVEGIVYQADANQLVRFTSSSALRFALTPNTQKRLEELRRGVEVQVGYPHAGKRKGESR